MDSSGMISIPPMTKFQVIYTHKLKSSFLYYDNLNKIEARNIILISQVRGVSGMCVEDHKIWFDLDLSVKCTSPSKAKHEILGAPISISR